MKTAHTLKRIIAGALLTGGVAVAGFGPAAGTAHAYPGPYTWCPGKGLSPDDAAVENAWAAQKNEIRWDWNVCHTFYIYAPASNVGAHDIWEGNNPPAPPPQPPPRMCGPVPCGLFP